MVSQTGSAIVSVIIPTHNRAGLLPLMLRAVAQQTYPSQQMEVIVVDDGSTDDTPNVVKTFTELQLKCVTHTNQGATLARNLGAQQATGQWLVFMDDDIELLPGSIAALLDTLAGTQQTVVVGTLLADDRMESTGGLEVKTIPGEPPSTTDITAIPATRCFTGLLGIRRQDFIDLGMFQDPTGGWPNWDDVDFGYRAHRAGYRLLRNRKAEAIHHDLAATNLKAAASRWYRASQSAVRLIQKYPDLYNSLPMFHDKTPIRWGRDPRRLVLRKLARQIVSSKASILSLFALNRLLEALHLSSELLNVIRRWIIGGYVYRGIREGLKTYGALPE
jgi:glycosyltransferase involved in cell wall biosynthesis